ncbi:MAG TPA: hypothetical protein VIV11_39895 [Kofleriaceae bacterium]
MRVVAIVTAGLLVAVPARADERDDLQAKGEQLAKDGRYGDAIDAFKAADRIQPRAIHACLIALAYTRRENWPQAEVFLSICNERASAGDPLPDWVPIANEQIKQRLAAANVAAVTIEVLPVGVASKVTVSSFAPDEVFEPRTIHLPIGTHVVFARADGYPERQYTIEIKGKADQKIVIDLAAKTELAPPPAEPKRRGVPLLIGGAAAVMLGVGTHVWLGYERSKLVEAQSPPNRALYDDHSAKFDVALYSTIALYSLGAVGVVVGYLQFRGSGKETTAVSAMPLPEGGGLVTLGWQQ